MIDLHTHILPDTDDGPDSDEESLDMAAAAVADGIHTVVATPHTLNGAHVTFMDRVRAETRRLQEAARDRGLDITLVPGLEVHLVPDIISHLRDGTAGTIADNGRYLLLELPLSVMAEPARNTVYDLKRQGITPVLAHPERVPTFWDRPGLLSDLVAMGALCQITADSITGGWGRDAKKFSAKMLSAGLVHVIASDSHSARLRPPRLTDAVAAAARILKSRDRARRLVTDNPAAIVAGEPVDVDDPLPLK